MKYEIRELTVGGILDQAISIVKNRFGLLFGITFVLYVPCTILLGLWTLSVLPDASNITTAEQLNAYNAKVMEALPMTLGVSLIVGLIIGPLTNAAVIHAIAKEYLQQPISLGGAFSRGMSAILPLIGTGILVGLIVMLGMFLLIIPGIIFMFWYLLYMQVVVIEGVSGTEAMSRSKALMKGNTMTAIVLGVMVFIIAACLQFASQIVGGNMGVVLQNLMQGVLFVFTTSAWVVFYFSCRCKNEDFDLAILAESIDEGAAGRDPSFDQI